MRADRANVPSALRRPSALVLVAGLLGTGLFFLVHPLFAAGTGYFGTHGPSSSYAYDWLVLALFVPYGFALRGWIRDGTGVGLRPTIVLSALVMIPLVFAPPQQSHDAYQYLFYGRMQVLHAANPYLVKPFVLGSDPWYRFIGWRGQVSVYGPLWMEAMALLAKISGASIGTGLVVLRALEVGLMVSVAVGLSRFAQGARDRVASLAPVAFALNPLVVTATGLGGHADIVLAAAFVWAMVWDGRRKPLLATAALTAAALVKAYAAPFLLVYLVVRLRRDGSRAAVSSVSLAVAMTVLAFVPYWKGPGIFEGILQVGAQGSSTLASAMQEAVALAFPASRAWIAADLIRSTGGVILIAAMIRVAFSRRTLSDPWRGALIVTGVAFLVSPLFLSWYLVGPLAVALVSGDPALRSGYLVASGSSGLTAPGAAARTAVRYLPPVLAYLRVRGAWGISRRGPASPTE